MQTQEQRNLPLAGQRLEQALRVAPDDPDVLSVMALWSAMMGKPKDEEAYSRKAIASNSDSITAITARLYLGEALQAQGKLGEAAQEFRQMLAIEPDNYDAHNDLGINFAPTGINAGSAKGIPAFSGHSTRSGNTPRRNRQDSSYANASLPQAIEEFTQALRFNPANAGVHNDLGMALFQLGDYEKAVEQFSDAVRINPADADARRNLDLAQARMKTKKVENVR